MEPKADPDSYYNTRWILKITRNQSIYEMYYLLGKLMIGHAGEHLIRICVIHAGLPARHVGRKPLLEQGSFDLTM